MQINLTVNQTEAAKLIGVHPKTIRNLEKKKLLSRLAVFGSPRYSVDQVKKNR